MPEQSHHVVILGATPKKDRYANQAMRLLLEKGYSVTPVHPKIEQIEQIKVVHSVKAIREKVNTLTLYVGTARLETMIAELIALKPGRVLFNPGTESSALQKQLDAAEIPWIEGCTLVMLKTGTFLDW